jgi:hypothetical protein
LPSLVNAQDLAVLVIPSGTTLLQLANAREALQQITIPTPTPAHRKRSAPTRRAGAAVKRRRSGKKHPATTARNPHLSGRRNLKNLIHAIFMALPPGTWLTKQRVLELLLTLDRYYMLNRPRLDLQQEARLLCYILDTRHRRLGITTIRCKCSATMYRNADSTYVCPISHSGAVSYTGNRH